ncbi:MAG: hypothetical protein WCI89_02080 [bacterium]
MLKKHLGMFMIPCDEDGQRSQLIHEFLSGELLEPYSIRNIELEESPSPRDLLIAIRAFVRSVSIAEKPAVIVGLAAFEAWVHIREEATV